MGGVEFLIARARIVRKIRAFFDARDFVEVETAVRIPAPAPEEHIDCPPCRDGGYLRASPELQMKKLLAAGMDCIYQVGPCFREGERGARHSPEFTMIEWYRRNATYLDIRKDLEELMATLTADEPPGISLQSLACGACPQESASPTSGACPQGLGRQTFVTLSVREAYCRFAEWDPWTDWDQDRFDVDMAMKIEPAIKALGGGVFLTDYPPQAASLAKISEEREKSCSLEDGLRGLSPRVAHAERWEFYWDGMELANCFTELCDEAEQRARFRVAKANRQALGESDYPLDEDFLSSLPCIGSAAGVALGIDRLVMALTGAKDISAVRAPL